MGLFSATKKLTDTFFDGLKGNAVNKALKEAEKNKKATPKVIQKMKEIDDASKDIEQMIREFE